MKGAAIRWIIKLFNLGDITLQSGATLPNAFLAYIPNAVFDPIESIWGHFASRGINSADNTFIDDNMKRLLELRTN